MITSDPEEDVMASTAEDHTTVDAWLAGRLPAEWFVEPVEVTIDREEITIVGRIPEVEAPDTEASEASAGRIARFRDETRGARMTIADEAEERFGRKVAWGVRCGETSAMFTRLAVPVMTRLRQPERRVLDTLVAGGVARSRADALAWCVRLVGEHTDEWLTRLRTAMEEVDRVRGEGPPV
jgi:hypothetical protein